MSRIAFVVTGDGGQRLKILSIIREATNLSYLDISRAIESKGPILEKDLFCRDHDEIVAVLRKLVSFLSEVGAMFEIYELPKSHSLINGNLSQVRRIEVTVLENILTAHETGLREQQESVDRELDED